MTSDTRKIDAEEEREKTCHTFSRFSANGLDDGHPSVHFCRYSMTTKWSEIRFDLMADGKTII